MADDGSGLPGAALEHGRSGGGSTGLGLDIAGRTAERSGGTLPMASCRAGTEITCDVGPPR